MRIPFTRSAIPATCLATPFSLIFALFKLIVPGVTILIKAPEERFKASLFSVLWQSKPLKLFL
jgi:hypothetical protein